MSEQTIEVKHVVVHILDKEQHGPASTRLSSSEKSVTGASQRLIDDICKRYSGRAGKGYGRFEGDLDNYPMERMAGDYQNGTDDFYQSSCRMMRHLVERAQSENMATGGYVLFAHIMTERHEHLLIAMVNATTGSTITDDLNIQDSVYLDIAKLRVAGRIDLTAWNEGAERYISFLKGQAEFSNYFKHFLGCNDVVIAARESEKLADALKVFASEKNLDETATAEFLGKAYERLQTLSKNKEPLSIDALANELWPQAPEELSGKLADEELGLSDGFIPDGRVIKRLVSFKGKSEHWKLEFDRAGVLDGSIEYNKEDGIIILRNVPDELKEALEKETAS